MSYGMDTFLQVQDIQVMEEDFMEGLCCVSTLVFYGWLYTFAENKVVICCVFLHNIHFLHTF